MITKSAQYPYNINQKHKIMNTIKYSLVNLSQPKFIDKVGFIVFCLTNNIYFTNLPVTVLDITTQLVDYEKALDKSKAGDKVETAKAIKLRAKIQELIKENGIYINLTAKGDMAMLESSGYDLAKEKTHKPKTSVSITPTSQPGEVKVFIPRVEGAAAYQVLICSEEIPPADKQYLWLRQPMTTKIYQLLENITPLKQYYLIYCSVTVLGESAMSDPPIPFIILK
jgi:hypothetical protein